MLSAMTSKDICRTPAENLIERIFEAIPMISPGPREIPESPMLALQLIKPCSSITYIHSYDIVTNAFTAHLIAT